MNSSSPLLMDFSFSPVDGRKNMHRRGLTDGGSAESKIRKLQTQQVYGLAPKRRLSFGASKKRGFSALFGGDLDLNIGDFEGNNSASQSLARKGVTVSPALKVITVNKAMSPAGKRSDSVEGSLLDATNDHIKVCVRIRPLVPAEVIENQSLAWSWDENKLTPTPSARPFIQRTSNSYHSNNGQSSEPTSLPAYYFDHLFNPHNTNQQIFSSVVESVVAAAMNGYHGSVFSYGQTSSGKTFTMSGGEQQPGIIPLAIRYCFDAVNMYPDREFLLRVSYLEVYNEQVNDLLVNRNAEQPPSSGNSPLSPRDSKEIKIQHDPKLGTVISGAREQVVNSPEQVINLLRFGEQQRHVGATEMNEQSSRAHSLFKIIIESKDKTKAFKAQVSTLNLVDLAGSECAKMTNARGERAREGRYINQSLLTLSTIIQRLSEDNNKQMMVPGGTTIRKQHLPFRDSKLTRILESALDGNAHIAIICTISPTLRCAEESLNTLKFAARAKQIKMHARVNEVVDDKTLLKSYKQEIEQLKQKLKELESVSFPVMNNISENRDDDPPKEEFMAEIIAEMEKLILRADASKSLMAKSSTQVLTRMSSIDTKLKDNIKYDFDDEDKSCGSDDPSVGSRVSLSATWQPSNRSQSLLLNHRSSLLTEDGQPSSSFSPKASRKHLKTSELMHQEEDSVLFGVTKILSILKDAVAKSKSKVLTMKAASPKSSKNEENVDLNKWGYSHNAVEQLISISKSMDEGDLGNGIGSIAQAQFERLKLDLQLKDADNRFLQEELDQKDKVMAMLTEGLKEVEQIQAQWVATNRDLSHDLTRAIEDNAALSEEIILLRNTIADKNARIEALSKEKERIRKKGIAIGCQTDWLADCPVCSPKSAKNTSTTPFTGGPGPPALKSPPAAITPPPSVHASGATDGFVPSVSVQALRKNFSEPKAYELPVRRNSAFSGGVKSPPPAENVRNSIAVQQPASSDISGSRTATSSQQIPQPSRSSLMAVFQKEDAQSPKPVSTNSAASANASATTITQKPAESIAKSSRSSMTFRTNNLDFSASNPQLTRRVSGGKELVPSSEAQTVTKEDQALSSSASAVGRVEGPVEVVTTMKESDSSSHLRAPSADDLTKTYPQNNVFDMSEILDRNDKATKGSIFRNILPRRLSNEGNGNVSKSSQQHLQQLSAAFNGENGGRKSLVSSLLAHKSSFMKQQRDLQPAAPLQSTAFSTSFINSIPKLPSEDGSLKFRGSDSPTESADSSLAPESKAVIPEIQLPIQNEEIQAEVVVVTAPKLKKGFLLKQAQTGIIKQWSQRYFVLDCGVLSYYDSASAYTASSEATSKGRPVSKGKEGFSLRGYEIISKEGKSLVSLTKDKQTLHLDIRPDHERIEWVKSLQEHIRFMSQQQQQ